MLVTSWSIALLFCMAISLFLLLIAAASAVKIINYWDITSDTELQISLEGRTWLVGALVENSLIIQIISLVLLVAAAGEFSGMIAGAMCATGTFLANEFGPPSLYIKIGGIFLYGLWIVLHRLDMCSEHYPLLRLKYYYLLFLLPIVLADSSLLLLFLINLSPDIITSCCGVIFSENMLKTSFLPTMGSSGGAVTLFYLLSLVILFQGLVLHRIGHRDGSPAVKYHLLYAILHVLFFLVALVCITLFFSSYIYAIPTHRCPFDILLQEYYFIGVPLYLTLFSSAFLGISGGVASIFLSRPGLGGPVALYCLFSVRNSLLLHFLFIVLATLPVFLYFFSGGEI